MSKNLWTATFLLLMMWGLGAEAQNKGINFQGVISTPNNKFPTLAGVTVNLKVLAPNECILWEEQHSAVNISAGYLNLVVGKGVVGGATPAGQTFQKVFSNSAVQVGLTCLDLDGAVKSDVISYTPATHDARRLRVDLYVNGDRVMADFNMRSLPFAVNSEMLAGKTESEFVQTSTQVTQARLEQFFQSITASAGGGSVRWDGSSFVSYDATSGGNLGDASVPWSKLTSIPSPLTQIGALSCSNDQILKVVGGVWTCAGEGAGGSGSVTSIGAGTGLLTSKAANAAITDSGTLSVNVGTGAGQIVQLDGNGKLPAMDGSALTNIAVSGGNFSNQNANVVFAGPSSGGAAAPGFRGLVVNDLPGSIPDSKFDVLATAGKVANSATTATSANTANAIVARGLSGEISTGAISAGSVTSSGQIGAGLVEHASLNTNWNSGNIQTTTAAAGTLTFTASSMKNGSNYMLILKTAGTFTLSNTGDVTTWKCLPACPSRQIVATGETVLTIIKVGNTGYVSWMAGF